MTKQQVLEQSTFGKRVAEEEIDALGEYFVKTSLYDRIFAGHVDVIYGAKGSGKSAIYFSLLKADNELFGSGSLDQVRRESARHAGVQGSRIRSACLRRRVSRSMEAILPQLNRNRFARFWCSKRRSRATQCLLRVC